MTGYNGTAGVPVSYSYSYDRYGNRYGANPGANITINKGNNIVQVSGFYNDAPGNMTDDSVHSYQFDAENNVVSVDGGSTATYTYNALNQRAGISNAQGAKEFTYDFAGRRVGTWTPGSLVGLQGQAWFGNTPLAYRDLDGSTYFQQADWEGTQRMLTNYTGSISSQYTSRPWGDAYATTGKDDNISHYAGLEQSESTGIQHATFRDYDSNLGRWLAPDSYTGSYDWTNPQSFNRFSYAMNQPNGSIDPSGLDDCNNASYDGVPCLTQTQGPGTGQGGDGGGGYGGAHPGPRPQRPPDRSDGGGGGGGWGPRRRLNPNGQECRALAKRISNIVDQITHRQTELQTNPLNLPELAPYPGAPYRASMQGHRELLDIYIQNLADRANEYNQKCGGDDPFGGGGSAAVQDSGSSSAPTISPATKSGVVVLGGAIIVGGTAILCPECLVGAAIGLAF